MQSDTHLPNCTTLQPWREGRREQWRKMSDCKQCVVIVLSTLRGCGKKSVKWSEVNAEWGWRSRTSQKWVERSPQPCTFSDAVIDRSEVTAGCKYFHDQGLHTTLRLTLIYYYETRNYDQDTEGQTSNPSASFPVWWCLSRRLQFDRIQHITIFYIDVKVFEKSHASHWRKEENYKNRRDVYLKIFRTLYQTARRHIL